MGRPPESSRTDMTERFLQRLRSWAKPRADVRALVVVGSVARGKARPDSDVDLVLLTTAPARYLEDLAWVSDLGPVQRTQVEAYGAVTSVRAMYAGGLEVEFGIARQDWASAPFDSGTLEVVRDGMVVVLDRDGHATALATAAARGSRPRMERYYAARLAGARLQKVYELAPARVAQYLEAEIAFVRGRLAATDAALELGCGYGRVAFRLAEVARRVVGIDTAGESLRLARRLAGPASRCEFLGMDATALAFRDGAFDAVACVQNGVCAFGVGPERLVREALRVARPGGRILFSTYAPAFWTERLRWFEAQAAAGLLGEIDRDRTGNGAIVCKDGFRAGALTPEEFRTLAGRFGVQPVITIVDDSSLFCELVRPGGVRS